MIEFFHKHVLLCSSLADAPKVPIACTTLDLQAVLVFFLFRPFYRSVVLLKVNLGVDNGVKEAKRLTPPISMGKAFPST